MLRKFINTKSVSLLENGGKDVNLYKRRLNYEARLFKRKQYRGISERAFFIKRTTVYIRLKLSRI
jgi:hypothetical protein